jgi:hypothetical protein
LFSEMNELGLFVKKTAQKRPHKLHILLSITLLIISASIVTYSRASFNDVEASNSNSIEAWSSALWTQTSQSDFNAGVLSNLNTNLSPGDIILSAGGTADTNIILLWDASGTAPNGWSYLSNSGGDFFNRFPRGASTYGETGGAATHTHTISILSIGPPSTITSVSGSGTSRASTDHIHTVSSASAGTASNLSVYRNLRVIRYTSGVPETIPAGAIAMFDNTPPSGWTRYSDQDEFFLRGAAGTVVGTTGGSNTHTHSVTAGLTAASGDQPVSTSNPRASVATNVHTHGNISGTTDIAES